MLADTDPEGDSVPLALIVTVDVTKGLSRLEVDLERVGEALLQPVLVRLFVFEAVLVAIVLGVDVVLPVVEPVGETVVEAVFETVSVVDSDNIADAKALSLGWDEADAQELELDEPEADGDPAVEHVSYAVEEGVAVRDSVNVLIGFSSY